MLAADDEKKTLFQRPDQVTHPLYIVTTVFNPVRWRSRWKLYQDFAKHVKEAGAILYTVEVAFGHREFVLTEENNPRHIRLSTTHELWLKEIAQNIGVSRLPLDWRYVGLVDADVQFARHDWANETIHQLQHHKVVQMWSEGMDLDPDYQTLLQSKSFAWCYANNVRKDKSQIFDGYYYYQKDSKVVYEHPGYAWAYRREAFNAVQGLIDHCILGSGDYHMANALIGRAEETLKRPLHPNYKTPILKWQDRAKSFINQDIGYVPGLVMHHWHGPKANRKYLDRWKILVDTNFDPAAHIAKDWAGLWQLSNAPTELRDKLRAYFRQRNEDSV